MLDITMKKEVSGFLLASETLLSPDRGPSDLIEEECRMIAECVMSMCRWGHPWSTMLPL